MTNQVNATVDCQLVGDYVDEAQCPANPTPNRSEVVRTQFVANYMDVWGRDDGMREFTVLFKDGRTLVVRGHSLKHELPHASVYSIIARFGGAEAIVALFDSHDIVGIFQGELSPPRLSALPL